MVGAMHAQAVHANAHAELVAVCAPTPRKRTPLARRYGVAEHCTFEEMIAYSELDCVCIASPDGLHIPHVEAALAAGLHVFVEKPLGFSRTEAASVLSRAKAAGRIVGVNYNRRFTFGYRTTRELLSAGRIGRVRQIWLQVTDGTPSPHVATRDDVMHWTLLGHHYDLVQWLGGPIVSASAAVTSTRKAGIVRDLAVHFQLESGAIACLAVAYRDGQTRTTERCELVGEEGGIIVSDATRSVSVFQEDPDCVTVLRPNPFHAGDQFYASLADHIQVFFDRLAVADLPPVSAADAVRTNIIAETVLESVAIGRTTIVPAGGA